MDIYKVEINSILRCKQVEFIQANSPEHAEEIAMSQIELRLDTDCSVSNYDAEVLKPEHVNAIHPEECVYTDAENEDVPWEKTNLLEYLKQQETI